MNEFEVDTEFVDVSMSTERSTLSFVKREDATCEFTETLDETRSSGGSSQVPKLPLSHLRSETKPMLSVREMCETSSGQIWPSMKLQPSRRKPPVWVGQSTGRKVTWRNRQTFCVDDPYHIGFYWPDFLLGHKTSKRPFFVIKRHGIDSTALNGQEGYITLF